MTDANAARRERALKFVESSWAPTPKEISDWLASMQPLLSLDDEERVIGYLAGAQEEAARAAEKLRAAARETRTPFGEALAHLADEIEEGR